MTTYDYASLYSEWVDGIVYDISTRVNKVKQRLKGVTSLEMDTAPRMKAVSENTMIPCTMKIPAILKSSATYICEIRRRYYTPHHNINLKPKK